MHVSVCVICMQTGHLGLISGLNVKAATVAVMKLVITTQLAHLFNFCRKHGKHGFLALQLKGVVCGWCCDWCVTSHFITNACLHFLSVLLDKFIV